MKKIFIPIICLVSFLVFSFNAKAEEVEISSNNAVLYNLNDTNIIYEKNKDEKVYIASLTKIMTTIVAIENIKDLDEEVTITKEMLENTSGYAVAGLEVGDKLSYYDLLNAAMLKSAADAVNAITLSVSKTETEFVKLMNDKAEDLKLENTNFTNPVGKDNKNNYSTVNDVAKLIIYSLKNEDFKKIWEAKEYKLDDEKTLKNPIYSKVEKLKLDSFKEDYITGSKSGYTDDAKYCLSSTSKIDGVEYLAVVIDNKNKEDNSVSDSVKLYQYYSDNYSYKKIVGLGQKITTIHVKNSPKKISILETSAVELYLPNTIQIENLEYEYTGKTSITKNTPVGTKLGVLKVKDNGKVVYKEDVKLNTAIGFVFSYYYLIHISIFIILCILIVKVRKKANN